MILFRPLSEKDFGQLHQTLLEAFSDYFVTMQPEIDALQRLYQMEGVRLDHSFGAFDGDKMVGFTVNGIGEWRGKLSAYDAGTGVIPAYRRRGVSRRMFGEILPFLRKCHIEQYLLEVIFENTPAFDFYWSLGFQVERELAVFKQDKVLTTEEANLSNRKDTEIKEIENPDWKLLQSFWTHQPSWQNSVDSMKRSTTEAEINKKVLGVFLNERLIGYGIVFPKSGNVPQFAIAENHRRKGFGGALLSALRNQAKSDLKVYNVDEKARDVTAFLEAKGFSLLTRQYEMLLKL